MRLREIPYNYTSFSDREIAIRLLGPRQFAPLLDELRAERAPGAAHECCTRCSATSGSCKRNPYLGGDLLNNPKRRKLLIEALHHRLGEIEKRRNGAPASTLDHDRDAKVGQLLLAARKCDRGFEAAFPRHLGTCASARAELLGAPHAR